MKLKIVNLTVEIDKKIILDNLNLDIGEGEIHAVMGPNGVGKSTLSHVIMGDDRYHVIEGDIIFDGESIIKKPIDERSRMGIFLAMQSPQEIDGVSNQDFLRTALAQKNKKKVNLYEFINDCENAVKDLDMNKELIHRSLNVGFSGGEKKKNEVLQIKLLKPSLIILDELDSGLDVDSLKIVCKNLKDYLKNNKDVSVIIITHYSMILDYLKPDYVHILANKKFVKKGTKELIKDIEENGYSKYLDEKSIGRVDLDE
ncbi:MAG: Fe-S cluster assembly ATPase SufC [Bacilli bacterium]|nr:Fe-S cluster assembly ATPase SufC [Bacilli bacterium]